MSKNTTNVFTLKFKGDKSAEGRKVGEHFIGKLVNGAVTDHRGVRIGSYQRLVTDGGAHGDWQEIKITLEI